MTKTCSTCGKTKSIKEFGYRNEKRTDGTPYMYYRPRCKVCRNKRETELRATPESQARRQKQRKEYYYKNIEKIKAKRRTPEYKEKNREYQREYKKRHGIISRPRMTVHQRLEKEAKEGYASCSKCRERLPLENFRYWNSKRYQCRVRNNYCTACENTRFKVLRQTDKYKNRMNEYQKIYRHGRNYRNYRKKYRSDPSVRMRESISVQVRTHIKNVTNGINKKSGKLFDHLEYTPEELVGHLEILFKEGMSWNNYGEWHVDHICPQAALPYDSMEHPNFQKCWALENLQPLWASENASKNSYYNGKKHFYKD